jgi:hypothetical protein
MNNSSILRSPGHHSDEYELAVTNEVDISRID